MMLPQVASAAASQAVSGTLFLSRLGPAANQGAAVTHAVAAVPAVMQLCQLSGIGLTQYSVPNWKLHFASLCITLHNFAIWDRANIILETLQRNLQNKPRNEHRVQKSVQPLAASRWHSHPQMTEFARPVSLKT